MRVTVVGGGNIGTQFAVHFAEKGHGVVVYTSQPEVFGTHLKIVDDEGVTIHEGEILEATNDPKRAFADAEMILVTFPSACMGRAAEVISRYADSRAWIGVVPGNGGSECAFRECIGRGNVFFGIERVPAIARLVEKGKTVRSTGYRNQLHVSSIPASCVQECCRRLSAVFDRECLPIPNFLNLTMTPSNPILHTTRLRTIFHDYQEGVVYQKLPLFYEEWDDASSELLLACDDEVQQICRALPEFHLEYVKSLRLHYESPTVKAMTNKISSIPAFRGLGTPSIKVEDGWIPDLHSRYFTADFSYGLSVIQQIGQFAGVKTPNIDETMDWYRGIALETEEFRYSDFGIQTREDFMRFYL